MASFNQKNNKVVAKEEKNTTATEGENHYDYDH